METLTAIFSSGNAMRSRSVSAVVHSAVLDVPVPTPRLLADWQREIAGQLGLEPGDIEALPLARTRLRWPELRDCIAAVQAWMAGLGLADVLASSEMALMASRGTRYHHDGATYGGKAFCNLFLSEDSGTDLHFPAAGHRIALVRGTAVFFDCCQPHAIIKRGSRGFAAADFAPAHVRPQVFLTWELPVEHATVRQALGITLDPASATAPLAQQQQVWRAGAPVQLCPQTGDWLNPP